MYRAVTRGFVTPLHAHFVHQGLRWGFDLGFSSSKLPGRRYFKNYVSAIEAKAAVSKDIHKRLINQKSYSLFPSKKSGGHASGTLSAIGHLHLTIKYILVRYLTEAQRA